MSNGAFDLSTLAASGGQNTTGQSTPASADFSHSQSAAPSSPMFPLSSESSVNREAAAGGAPLSVEIRQDNIQSILGNSTRFPILVVCMSSRAPASIQLAEEIETLARESAGRFQVARLDADMHPEFMQAFGVRGVPAVIAVLHGQLAPLFEGVPRKDELVSVVNQVLQAAVQSGMTERVAVDSGEEESVLPLPPHHQEGQEALESGDVETARTEFEAALKDNPGDSFAKAGLARVGFMERLDNIDVSAVLTSGASIAVTDVQGRLEYADALLGAGYVSESFDCLIETVKVTTGDERDVVRHRCVDMFDVVGADDSRVLQARRSLASALF